MLHRVFQSRKWSVIVLLFVFVATTGLGCRGTSQEVQERLAPVFLEYWTVNNDSFEFFPAIEAYRQSHPNVNITVRKFRFEEYERELINALAENRGPDIYSIHNTWTNGYTNKLAPMPASIELPFQFVAGTLRKELQTELRTTRGITPAELKRLYPDVVFQDAIDDGNIYGLPLSMDNMVLYYNIDMLNNAGVATPPTTWEEFRQQVIQITQLGAEGEILTSAAAIGTADNVSRRFDLLSLLMMQNGAQMTDDAGTPRFHRVPPGFEGNVGPSEQAVDFYTSFANPAAENYTFSEDFPQDIDAFVNGQTAFFFGYHFNLDDIRARAPKLNFGVNPMLQIGQGASINYANYWMEGVSARSEHQDWSWDFLLFIANADNVDLYLEQNNRLSGLRSKINGYLEDEDLRIHAEQLLTSRSWYQGKSVQGAIDAFDELIKNTLRPIDNQSGQRRLDVAASKVFQTY